MCSTVQEAMLIEGKSRVTERLTVLLLFSLSSHEVGCRPGSESETAAKRDQVPYPARQGSAV